LAYSFIGTKAILFFLT